MKTGQSTCNVVYVSMIVHVHVSNTTKSLFALKMRAHAKLSATTSIILQHKHKEGHGTHISLILGECFEQLKICKDSVESMLAACDACLTPRGK